MYRIIRYQVFSQLCLPPNSYGGGWPGAEQAKAETAGGIDSSGAALESAESAEQAKAETGVARLYGAPLWVWRAT